MFFNAALLSTLVLAASNVAANPHLHHAHQARSALPSSSWYHGRDHPAYELFRRTHDKRQANGTGPAIGSPEWAAQYPPGPADTTKLPKAWTDALNAAVAAGKIPNVPPTTVSGTSDPKYPNGLDPSSNQVCSATARTCKIPGDIWDAPAGMIGVGFDDGPTTNSPPLYNYLKAQKQRVTHFMIGTNILANWQIFNTAYADLKNDIAVHTWTHPYMTSKSNLEVLGELAWTMQIIHDLTGGKLPAFWRPPYGDTDARVSAIAREVLGMTAIIWNQDTDDWSLVNTPPGTSQAAINASFVKWIAGPKTPGLIILEHELYPETAQAFYNNYPLMKTNGWTPVSTVLLASSDWSQNGTGSDGAFSVSKVAPSSSSSTPVNHTSTAAVSSSSGSGSPSNQAKTGAALRGVSSIPALTVLGLSAAFLFTFL